MALYESYGKISEMTEVQEGVSKNGYHWRNMTLVIEMDGFQGAVVRQAYQVSGESVDQVLGFKTGDKVTVKWSMYAREWEGKWYNSVNLVSIAPYEKKETHITEKTSLKVSDERKKAAREKVEQVLNGEISGDGHEDDLPF